MPFGNRRRGLKEGRSAGATLRIEDNGLIGDTHTAALVGRDGSIDWPCVPRFDSPACLAALLGDERHGRWRLVPTGEETRTARRYRGESLVLEGRRSPEEYWERHPGSLCH